MGRRRGRLGDGELERFENIAAASAGILQDCIRLYHAVQAIADEDLRRAATEDVIDAFRSAVEIHRANREALEEARERARGKGGAT